MKKKEFFLFKAWVFYPMICIFLAIVILDTIARNNPLRAAIKIPSLAIIPQNSYEEGDVVMTKAGNKYIVRRCKNSWCAFYGYSGVDGLTHMPKEYIVGKVKEATK